MQHIVVALVLPKYELRGNLKISAELFLSNRHSVNKCVSLVMEFQLLIYESGVRLVVELASARGRKMLGSLALAPTVY